MGISRIMYRKMNEDQIVCFVRDGIDGIERAGQIVMRSGTMQVEEGMETVAACGVFKLL